MREEMSPKRAGRIIRSFGIKPKKKQESYTFRADSKRLKELVEKHVPKARDPNG